MTSKLFNGETNKPSQLGVPKRGEVPFRPVIAENAKLQRNRNQYLHFRSSSASNLIDTNGASQHGQASQIIHFSKRSGSFLLPNHANF